MSAWRAFRELRAGHADEVSTLKGLAEVHLMLGHPRIARAYAQRALQLAPRDQGAMALTVRGLLRSRSFATAVREADDFVSTVEAPRPELLAAQASALFRIRKGDAAATLYSRVVDLEPLHAEAHLRLGSGLTGPVRIATTVELADAVLELRAGRTESAVQKFLALLQDDPVHPVAHRLLGETLYRERARQTMASGDPAYRELAAALRASDRDFPIRGFVTGYGSLTPARRAVIDRALSLFGRYVGLLVDMGGGHDLLGETERTTDSPFRSNLRGKRTFDGRIWDDVRGIGGLRAATGVEALDDAALHGYDTFAHEVAHQVHLYAMGHRERSRIRALYRRARAEGRFLDYYAASNEAEYFGQGAEAFASLGKRPGGEATHNHTRFELIRVDPGLHDFIANLVERDPLESLERERLLRAAVAVALRSGRAADAVVAASMLDSGPERDRLLGQSRRALLLSRSY